MTWNYRIVEKTLPCGEIQQGIHECYYNDRTGEPEWITEHTFSIVWNKGASTHLILEEIKEAFRKPILFYEDFENRTPF
jgi:hypothetical protein